MDEPSGLIISAKTDGLNTGCNSRRIYYKWIKIPQDIENAWKHWNHKHRKRGVTFKPSCNVSDMLLILWALTCFHWESEKQKDINDDTMPLQIYKRKQAVKANLSRRKH